MPKRSGAARRQRDAKHNRNRARAAAMAALSHDVHSLTSRLMGDPAPGRSALERPVADLTADISIGAGGEPLNLAAVPLLAIELIDEPDDSGDLDI